MVCGLDHSGSQPFIYKQDCVLKLNTVFVFMYIYTFNVFVCKQ